jgi:hypothetical protein
MTFIRDELYAQTQRLPRLEASSASSRTNCCRSQQTTENREVLIEVRPLLLARDGVADRPEAMPGRSRGTNRAQPGRPC